MNLGLKTRMEIAKWFNPKSVHATFAPSLIIIPSPSSNEPEYKPTITNIAGIPIEDGRIRFMHLRFHSKEQQKGTNKFGICNKGGVTIAYQRSEDLRHFRYAIAICNLDDNFSRYKGRMIAMHYLDHTDDEYYIIHSEVMIPNSAFLQNNVLKTVSAKISKLYPKINLNKDLW